MSDSSVSDLVSGSLLCGENIFVALERELVGHRSPPSDPQFRSALVLLLDGAVGDLGELAGELVTPWSLVAAKRAIFPGWIAGMASAMRADPDLLEAGVWATELEQALQRSLASLPDSSEALDALLQGLNMTPEQFLQHSFGGHMEFGSMNQWREGALTLGGLLLLQPTAVLWATVFEKGAD